jgi:hypothetical protein
MRKRKLILWDTMFIELHGPREWERDRTANRHAKKFLVAIRDAANKCLQEHRKKSAVMKRFRITIEGEG